MRPSPACSTSRQSNATRSTTTRLRTGKDAPANLLSCRRQPLPQPPSGTFPDYLCHHSKPPAENWSLLVTRQILDPSWFDKQISLYLNTNVSVIWSVFLFTQNIFNFWLPLLSDYPILSSKFFIALRMNLSLLLYEVYMHFAANSPFSTLPEAYNKPVSLESMWLVAEKVCWGV